MIWEARVHLEQYPNSHGPLRDLGILDLDGDTQERGHVKFSLDGKPEVGLIEHIAPVDWQDRPGTIPIVHISLPRMSSQLSES
jgi:hypothetical protein